MVIIYVPISNTAETSEGVLLDEDVRNALKQAYIEVEGETLRNSGDRDLLIFASLIRNQDTNRAYAEVSNNNNILLKGMRRSTFFQNVSYLQSLG
ncbi:hypothetical protein DMB44_08850 [Thermoplasma sp. Kam2015]|uniref:hypothetical protein n=1 Tax=Thermoplasma sp. Kam2015 TaxID=2094122 RepID=UPI000D9A89B6|nr:hypothetical protein [Thermoplasma sp. Kam2015]PYB67516.1 hypothetical protein DMB44_08850 [Thermoplasma sp. Kam2015]